MDGCGWNDIAGPPKGNPTQRRRPHQAAEFANRSTARGARTIMARKWGSALSAGGRRSISPSVVVSRPTDTGCFNSAQQIGPRCFQAPSFVAAVLGEHDQQYLTLPAAQRPPPRPLMTGAGH